MYAGLSALTPPLLALGLLTVSSPASAAHGHDILDIVASPGLGADLGGQPVAIDLDDGSSGLIVASMRNGQGTLVRLDNFGERSGPARTLDSSIEALAVDRSTHNIIVGGAAGLTVLGPDFEPLWQRPLTAGPGELRVAVGEQGTVAALAGGVLHVFSAQGHALGQTRPDHEVLRGLAVVDDAALVITTGWSRRRACGEQIDVAALSAFAHDGSPRWHAYGHATEAELCGHHDDPASTRGVAVARGNDGLLYLLAEVEGRDDLFRGRPGQPGIAAENVSFDMYTDPETANPAQFAYFARFTTAGEHMVGQYFVLPAADSVVRPRAIAADVHGNVYLAGAASHSLGAADDVAMTESLGRMAGFFQVVAADFGGRRSWQQLDADDMRTDLTALAVTDDRAVTLLDAAPVEGRTEGALPTGPSVLMWEGGFGPVAAEKRPDPESQGTFGYDSGVSGSDPTCYCDTSPPAPAALLTLAMFGLAGLQRPRRRT